MFKKKFYVLSFLNLASKSHAIDFIIHIPGHGFSENWLPDLLLDVKRLRRDDWLFINPFGTELPTKAQSF